MYSAWPFAAARTPTVSQRAPPEAAAFNACCSHPTMEVGEKEKLRMFPFWFKYEQGSRRHFTHVVSLTEARKWLIS